MNKTVLSGIVMTTFSYFLFSLQDASVKWLVVGYSVWQVLFTRSITILLICLVIGRGKLVRSAMASPVIKPLFVRNLLLLAAWLCYYNAARDLGLAEMTTLYYAAPIVVTLLAVPVLKEDVPPIRWFAVFIGFVGVLIACDPLGTGMKPSLPVCLALTAAVFWAIGTVMLRKTALQEETLTQITISNVFFIAMTGLAVGFFWTPPALFDVALMAGTGVIAGIAQYALFEGMRRAPISVIAPFEYTSLVWAFGLGFLIWGDVPTVNVFAGAGLIFAAGLLIIIGERLAHRRESAAA